MADGELYDLREALDELRNLYGRPEHSWEQQRLQAELLLWCIRAEDPIPQNNTAVSCLEARSAAAKG